MRPIILSGTATRMEKMSTAGPMIAVVIKIPGRKTPVYTVMRNPYFKHELDGSGLEGDGFQHTMRDVSKVVKKIIPVIDHGSDLAMLAGTYTGNPAVVAAGATGKAVAGVTRALIGGGKKTPKMQLPLKSLRYRVIETR